MKLILDIEESTLKNMQGYCAQNGLDLSEVVENLFNKHIQTPATIIDEIHERDGNLEDLEKFSKLLKIYLNDAIDDIAASMQTEERYSTDDAMIEVLTTLRDMRRNSYVLTTLYKTYEKKKPTY